MSLEVIATTQFTLGITDNETFCPHGCPESVQTCTFSYPANLSQEAVRGILCGLMEHVEDGHEMNEIPGMDEFMDRWFFDTPIQDIFDDIPEEIRYLVNFETMEDSGVIIAMENIEDFMSGLVAFKQAMFEARSNGAISRNFKLLPLYSHHDSRYLKLWKIDDGDVEEEIFENEGEELKNVEIFPIAASFH